MSEQESSVFIGPFRDNENDCYLRQLWDRKLYRFLRSWFRTVEMDPTIGPDERGLTRIKKTDSGESWGIPPGDGGGSSYDYASYFKVYDASTESECRIGVQDGYDPDSDFCGSVIINGKFNVHVDKCIVVPDLASTWTAYLFCWIDETTGGGAEIVINSSGAPIAPVEASPANMLTFGSIVLGRATVEEDGSSDLVITGTNQDYLRGGTAQVLILGECGDDVKVEL